MSLHGYRATKITEVGKRASVSTRDFYRHFKSKEECFLAAFEVIRDHLENLIRAAAADEVEWSRQVICALRAGLEFFATAPDVARFFLLEPTAATQAIALRYREAVLDCVPALARGRSQLADPESMPPDTESSLIGGVVSLVTRAIAAGEAERLPRLLPDAVEFTLAPYLGAEEAAQLAVEAGAC